MVSKKGARIVTGQPKNLDYDQLENEEPAAWHQDDIHVYEDHAMVYSSTNDNLDRGFASESASWELKFPNVWAALQHTGFSRYGIGCKVTVTVNGQEIKSENEARDVLGRENDNWYIIPIQEDYLCHVACPDRDEAGKYSSCLHENRQYKVHSPCDKDICPIAYESKTGDPPLGIRQGSELRDILRDLLINNTWDDDHEITHLGPCRLNQDKEEPGNCTCGLDEKMKRIRELI
jgi:hypothetical protein